VKRAAFIPRASEFNLKQAKPHFWHIFQQKYQQKGIIKK
jgi:hypothetical protein